MNSIWGFLKEVHCHSVQFTEVRQAQYSKGGVWGETVSSTISSTGFFFVLFLKTVYFL